MNNKPLISIIVPVYNTAKYLKRCFQSIQQQTFEDFEIIAIDDGSKDNSLDILKKLQLNDKRIKIYSQQNKGLSATRNYGISLSQANLLSFIDSDDTIELDMLNLMYQSFIKLNQIDIVFTRCNYLDTDGNIIGISKKLPLNKETFFSKIIDNSISPGAPLGLYNKQLFVKNSIKYPEQTFFEDITTTYKLIFYSKSIIFIQKPLYNYYNNNNSISNNFSKKHIEDLFKTIEDLKLFLIKHKIFKKYNKQYRDKIINLMRYISYKIKQNNYSVLKTNNIIQNTFLIINQNQYLQQIHISKTILEIRNLLQLVDTQLQNKIINKYIKLETYQISFIKKALLSEYGLFHKVIDKLQKDNIQEIYIYAAGELCKNITKKLENIGIKIIAVIDKNYKNSKCNYNIISIEKFYQIDTPNTNVVILSEFYAQEILKNIKFKGKKYYFYMQLEELD